MMFVSGSLACTLSAKALKSAASEARIDFSNGSFLGQGFLAFSAANRGNADDATSRLASQIRIGTGGEETRLMASPVLKKGRLGGDQPLMADSPPAASD
jgi:hypothetical protein